jgi:S1-C subfamily serine protease
VTVLVTVAVTGCGVLPPFPDLPAQSASEIAALDITPTATPEDAASPDNAASPDETGTQPQDLSPAGFDAAQRAAVRIRNIGCGSLATGSGFALDTTTVITNRHVVADAQTLQISTFDGTDIAVESVKIADIADLAIIRTKDPLPEVPTLRGHDPQTDEPVTIVGYPEGGKLTVSEGKIVGRADDPLKTMDGKVWVTDAEVEPGSSGSAAMDASGAVIGVVYAKTDQGYSLLVPVSLLQELLSDAEGFEPLKPCQ